MVCTQPRAMAATTVAKRVAEEFDGAPVGHSVGFETGRGKPVRGSSIMFTTGRTSARSACSLWTRRTSGGGSWDTLEVPSWHATMTWHTHAYFPLTRFADTPGCDKSGSAVSAALPSSTASSPC